MKRVVNRKKSTGRSKGSKQIEPEVQFPEQQTVVIAEYTEDLLRTEFKPPPSSPRPVFLLAPPCSSGALVCAMLGRNSQAYGLPETHLFTAETVAGWWAMCEKSTFRMADGLLRAVAQMFYGEQTDDCIKEAEGWLRRRSQLSTGLIYEALADRVSPLLMVEHSGTIVSRPVALRRMLRLFPMARIVQVTVHPRRFGEFLMKSIHEASKLGPVPYWMLNLASFPGASASEDGTPHKDSGLDPQRAWYVLNSNIATFLDPVPETQKLLLRVEDLMTDPSQTLGRVAGWLGLPTDDKAIEEMLHPERSPYACFGPTGARYGNESAFLQNPALSFEPVEAQSLEGALSWRHGGQGFLPKVKELARLFGYE